MGGLYLHIPFCNSKCAYCDFYSGPLRIFNAESYVEALARELDARRAEIDVISTVYVGGGTPSVMPPELLAPFLALASGECTVEVNPEDITPDYAERLIRAGANRISMGVQSLNDSELNAIGRRHTAARAIEAYNALRNVGFTNISLDLIYGLPGQSADSWRRSLGEVLSLTPEHLSAYMLSYEPGTLLYSRLQRGQIQETEEDTILEMYEDLCLHTRAAGFEHYEISNFALKGFRAAHNSAYWCMSPYLGLGPGAHSFDGRLRRFNDSNLKAYMLNPEGFAQIEEETPIQRHNDAIMTALRTCEGLDPSILTDSELSYARRVLLRTSSGRLRISESDWLRSNTLLLPLIRS